MYRNIVVLLVAVMVGGLTALFLQACRTTGRCDDGVCECPAGDSCDFTCRAPPCHARCSGDNDSCEAACANGTCACGGGSTCNFTCQAPPCHVSCSANTTCTGTCSNGDCDCGRDSSCTFTCATSPCHASCAEGARCVVLCLPGMAGTQGCNLTCAAGAPLICPGGNATTCGAACP